uniref:Uncharacterized protein n=1 Tax=Rhabditophanes sp. KR3021 TaxID=114890 RepID=A0AC35TNL6_9BILA
MFDIPLQNISDESDSQPPQESKRRNNFSSKALQSKGSTIASRSKSVADEGKHPKTSDLKTHNVESLASLKSTEPSQKEVSAKPLVSVKTAGFSTSDDDELPSKKKTGASRITQRNSHIVQIFSLQEI